jgi:glycerophosphoryl diester phosphodiesterase
VPANAAYPFLDWPGPLAFAHRGGASEVPENTMPAFEHAVRLGYRYLETDVHVTADGVLVAFHDDRLDRVTDRTGVIAELSWREVRQARVDGREPIPLLEDLLTAWPEVRINIDPKQDAAAEPLAAAILRTGATDRVCVGAFSDKRVARVRSLTGAALCTSMGPREVARLVSASRGGPGGSGIRSPCAQVPPRQGRVAIVTRGFVEVAHRQGVQVHVWTVDDRAEMTRLLDLGVDGIMTDRPQVLKELLVERGAWHEQPR